MKKTFRGLALFVVILLLQLTILPASKVDAEQSGVTLTEMNIKVMPEFINPAEWDYELPALLVGYFGTFTNNSDTPFEGELKLSAPTKLPHFKAGIVGHFKEGDADEPVKEDFTVNVEEETFSWTPKEPIEPNEKYEFVIEYFAGSIEGTTEREFSFEYTTETDLEKVNIAFYTPFKAEDFKLDKEHDVKSETMGLQFYLFEYSDAKQGDIFDFLVTYKKDNIVTTMEAIEDMQPPDDAAHAGVGQEGSKVAGDSEPLLSTENAILAGLTLIIVGVFVYVIARGKKGKKVVSKEKGIAPKKIVNKEEEIKKLRKMLADGNIDQKTYLEKRSKLE